MKRILLIIIFFTISSSSFSQGYYSNKDNHSFGFYLGTKLDLDEMSDNSLFTELYGTINVRNSTDSILFTFDDRFGKVQKRDVALIFGIRNALHLSEGYRRGIVSPFYGLRFAGNDKELNKWFLDLILRNDIIIQGDNNAHMFTVNPRIGFITDYRLSMYFGGDLFSVDRHIVNSYPNFIFGVGYNVRP